MSSYLSLKRHPQPLLILLYLCQIPKNEISQAKHLSVRNMGHMNESPRDEPISVEESASSAEANRTIPADPYMQTMNGC